MAIQIDRILSFNGNKYEATSAMIKYARFLTQKSENNLEILINRYAKDKVTAAAMNDILSKKITYSFETPAGKE